jgi:hypothetical protein
MKITPNHILLYRLDCHQNAKDPLPYLEYLKGAYPELKDILDDHIAEEYDYQLWLESKQGV